MECNFFNILFVLFLLLFLVVYVDFLELYQFTQLFLFGSFLLHSVGMVVEFVRIVHVTLCELSLDISVRMVFRYFGRAVLLGLAVLLMSIDCYNLNDFCFSLLLDCCSHSLLLFLLLSSHSCGFSFRFFLFLKLNLFDPVLFLFIRTVVTVDDGRNIDQWWLFFSRQSGCFCLFISWFIFLLFLLFLLFFLLIFLEEDIVDFCNIRFLLRINLLPRLLHLLQHLCRCYLSTFSQSAGLCSTICEIFLVLQTIYIHHHIAVIQRKHNL